MCLYKTHRFPKRAKKDIEVYKIIHFEPYNNPKGEFITPFKRATYSFGEVIKAEDHWLWGIFNKTIDGEGVHAYQTSNAARKGIGHVFPTNVHVKRAIIPKGAFYWLGDEEDIAATKMIVLKE